MTPKTRKYRFLEHTADIKFQAFGKNLNKAFENAALAVSNVISRGKSIAKKSKKSVELEGNDQKSLLYNFIDEIVYLIDAENFITSKAKVRITGNSLKAEFFGDKADRYNLDIVKASTYAEMFIKEEKGKATIQMVVDV